MSTTIYIDWEDDDVFWNDEVRDWEDVYYIIYDLGGVPLGGLYRNGNVIQIRLV
jgi:hypothetical protein